MSRFDLILVGAGSAGCMLASRLVREFGIRVALVEPPAEPAPAIDRSRPSRWLNLLGSTDDWNLQTAPSPALAARRLTWPRGRGLGGSSRINAMIWFPPTASDLRKLCEASGGHWSVERLQRAYQSMAGAVEPESPAWLSEVCQRFLQAVADFPDALPMVYSRLNRRGQRWLPSERLPMEDPGLTTVRATVDRLIWDRDTAIGVRLEAQTGSAELLADKGVVLTAGAIASPSILMRSGLGEREELARHRLDVRVELPAVGDSLRDHLIMPVVWETSRPSTPVRPFPTMRDLARWQVMGTGPIASNLAECGGLFEDRSLQIHVTPTHYLTYPQQGATAAMTIGVNVTQPQSSGCVRLVSQSPQDAPSIEPRYFDHEVDLSQTIRGVRLARDIASRSPLAEFIRRELVPGEKRLGDAEIARAVGRYAQTLYHPVGTCRLGLVDSVIDQRFAVHGVERLWVVDASILPQLTEGNPNATVMTLAWLAAEMISEQVTH